MGQSAEAAALQGNSPDGHRHFSEFGARFQTIPGEELIEPEIVYTARDREQTLSSTSAFNRLHSFGCGATIKSVI
jgi:hypothetical protein